MTRPTRLLAAVLPPWLTVRLLIAIPFATLLAVVLGLAIVRHQGGSFPVIAALVVLAGLALVWVGGALELLVLALFQHAHEAVHRIVPPVVDAALGGGVAAGLAVWLDTSVLEAATAGSVFFALYTAIVRKLVLGEAIDELVDSFVGRGTPLPPQYSLADSLAARGLTDAALAELERGAAERTGDPEPLVRGARLLRDAGRYDEAVAWLRRARARVPEAGAQDALITREIVELIRYRMGTPAGAAPELARMRDRHRGTSHGDWAERALREVRQTLIEG